MSDLKVIKECCLCFMKQFYSKFLVVTILILVAVLVYFVCVNALPLCKCSVHRDQKRTLDAPDLEFREL